jgi:hypothetical protein
MLVTIFLIALVWLGGLLALVGWLAAAPQPLEGKRWERSPRLLPDTRARFEEIVVTAFRSKTAPAQHVRDGAQQNLYVGP